MLGNLFKQIFFQKLTDFFLKKKWKERMNKKKVKLINENSDTAFTSLIYSVYLKLTNKFVQSRFLQIYAHIFVQNFNNFFFFTYFFGFVHTNACCKLTELLSCILQCQFYGWIYHTEEIYIWRIKKKVLNFIWWHYIVSYFVYLLLLFQNLN